MRAEDEGRTGMGPPPRAHARQSLGEMGLPLRLISCCSFLCCSSVVGYARSAEVTVTMASSGGLT